MNGVTAGHGHTTSNIVFTYQVWILLLLIWICVCSMSAHNMTDLPLQTFRARVRSTDVGHVVFALDYLCVCSQTCMCTHVRVCAYACTCAYMYGCVLICLRIQGHGNIYGSVNMAPVSCRFGSLSHALKHWSWPWEMCWSLAMENRVNLAWSVCARCGVLYIVRVVYIYAYISELCRCTCPELWIHALTFMGDDPLDSLWALQCRKPCVNIFFWSSWAIECWSCAPLSHMFKRTCVWTQIGQKKISTLGLLQCSIVGLNGSAWLQGRHSDLK